MVRRLSLGGRKVWPMVIAAGRQVFGWFLEQSLKNTCQRGLTGQPVALAFITH